jgi:myo-inositol-1(or 4)-monophosphatase
MFVQILQNAAKGAGQVLLTHFKKELTATPKTNYQNIVTQADIASQKFIREYILNAMVQNRISGRDVGFIGEEDLSVQGKHLFIIDPLDGTSNFASGFEYFCVTIAYAESGILQSGVTYHPITDTMYTAQRGQAAYKTVRGTQTPLLMTHHALKDSLLATVISSRSQLRDEWLKTVMPLNSVSRGTRIFGAGALDLAHLTDGTNHINMALYAHSGLWDIATAHLLLEATGGIMTDWKGVPITLQIHDPSQSYQVLACHKESLKEILALITAGR